MIFLYNDEAGKETLKLRGEDYKYLIKVRRHKESDTLHLRNENDPDILYTYTITDITPRELFLQLKKSEEKEVVPQKYLHIGWCMIDPKSIEKALPSLNEIGVSKISFIYCARSQKNFKPDLKRLHRILKASNQQCGRSSFMQFSIYDTLEHFVEEHEQIKVFDFCNTIFKNDHTYSDVLIGCEGGFSQEERAILSSKKIFRLDTPLVLRSENAACAVASKILL